MQRRVSVTVKTSSRAGGGAPDEVPVSYTVPGSLARTEAGYDLRYAEPDGNGMGGVVTSCTVLPDRIELRRSGAVTMALSFAEGLRSESDYAVAEGSVPIAVQTDRLRVRLGERGGLIELRYRLWLGGAPSGERQIKLRVETME